MKHCLNRKEQLVFRILWHGDFQLFFNRTWSFGHKINISEIVHKWRHEIFYIWWHSLLPLLDFSTKKAYGTVIKKLLIPSPSKAVTSFINVDLSSNCSFGTEIFIRYNQVFVKPNCSLKPSVRYNRIRHNRVPLYIVCFSRVSEDENPCHVSNDLRWIMKETSILFFLLQKLPG